ncbi:34-kDa subunit of RNA polymerase III (C) [Mycoemilia scoparia]|uniref:DNA-directed RNA polymerase III subunit RPC6 n=1 Tax=Mycoemilia scoparia TaxID=417184 RepID=A0A9W7ZUR5_9FUNG|nr:34-kDa subunit of RNA polymerase III (C) [Mycoemilia scoparia]
MAPPPPANDGLTKNERIFYDIACKQENGVTAEQLMELIPGIVAEDVANMVNKLSRRSMIEMCQLGGGLAYRGIKSEEQTKLSILTQDEQMVYRQIKESGNEGIWIRTIQKLTNLHQQVVSRCIKSLESKSLIKSVKSIKNPVKKLYMLIDVKPSQALTGGPWYTDQDLDVEFIDTLAQQIYKFIYSKSYPRHLPDAVFTAQHTAYPTTSQIRRYVMDNQISTVELDNKHIQELLDMLTFDGKIEPIVSSINMEGWGGRVGGGADNDDDDDDGDVGGDKTYKAIKLQQADSPLTDIPCGRCPISEFCSENGHISPSKCHYYQKWLQF